MATPRHKSAEAAKVKPTGIEFETDYSDGSGVEFAIRYFKNGRESLIEFEHINAIQFPIEKIDWLIACLDNIQHQIAESEE